MLLMQNYPFHDKHWKKAAKLIQKGQRPHVFPQVWNSANPVDQVLKKAMLMCHKQKPEDRATSRQVETYLQQELQQLDPGRLESWGVLASPKNTQKAPPQSTLPPNFRQTDNDGSNNAMDDDPLPPAFRQTDDDNDDDDGMNNAMDDDDVSSSSSSSK